MMVLYRYINRGLLYPPECELQNRVHNDIGENRGPKLCYELPGYIADAVIRSTCSFDVPGSSPTSVSGPEVIKNSCSTQLSMQI